MRYIAIVRGNVVASVVLFDYSDPLAIVAEVNSADDVIDVTDLTLRPGPEWTWSDDEFRPPAPFPSWEWDGTDWTPPVPYPSEPGPWIWNEDTGSWDSVTPATE